MDNQRFQFAIMAAEDQIRASRPRQSRSDDSIKRIFRIGADRGTVRHTGRR